MKTLDRKALRLMIVEALEEMKSCSECGAMYEVGENHSCGMEESDDPEIDESMGAGALGAGAGYTLPLDMRPSGPRRDSISRVAHRSFGGMPKKSKKR
jgi:hypothetical protein